MASRYDVVIVGLGSGGLTAARFAATLGLRVAAVERERVGGDCLWTGCVPSKALLASAKVAHHLRTADRYGLVASDGPIDTAPVWGRIRAIQAQIASGEDSPEALEKLGVELVRGEACLAGPHAVTAGGRTLEARRILLCTGSRPAIPDTPGLVAAGFVTSETIWDLERAPTSCVVVGGGPIGCELAQALNRLGTRVTLLHREPRLLPREEPELADRLAGVLRAEGVDVRLGAEPERVEQHGGQRVVVGAGEPCRAEAILVAAGRTPNVSGLGLVEAGVAVGPRGIEVDSTMRTSVRSIYAAGDVAGRFLFTHSAGYEAAIAVRNMVFPGSEKVTDLVPWTTFTDPELAHAGLTEAEARSRHRDVEVHRAELADSDRARSDGATDGALSLVTAKGRLVGAHVLAPGAGELIHELALAIRDGRKLTHLSSLVHAYPTIATSVNLLAADVSYDRARRLGWLIRRA